MDIHPGPVAGISAVLVLTPEANGFDPIVITSATEVGNDPLIRQSGVDLSRLPGAPSVSPRHAQIALSGPDHATLRDLGSHTGSFLRKAGSGTWQKIIGECRLQPGDAVSFGNIKFRVSFGSAPAPVTPTAFVQPQPAAMPRPQQYAAAAPPVQYASTTPAQVLPGSQPSPQALPPSGLLVQAMQQPQPRVPYSMQGNTSGMGPGYSPPPEAFGWTWAGFIPFGIFSFMHSQILWGILSLFLPIVPQIVIGMSGRRQSWEGKRFSSVQEFTDSMRIWNTIGLICFIIPALIGVFLGIAFGLGIVHALQS